MLGWEYPPNINGGLGTACQGLTVALARLGVKIDFIVPRLTGKEHAPHMNLLDSYYGGKEESEETVKNKTDPTKNISWFGIPSLLSPYARPESFDKWIEYCRAELKDDIPEDVADMLEDALESETGPVGEGLYGTDLFAEVERYTKNAIALAKKRRFDVVHAHDWMTYPAGIAISMMSNCPLVVHVHSLEYDRSGLGVNPKIHQIEGAGVKTADTPIAVSHYTKSVINSQHGVPLEKIAVVHNGVYAKEVIRSYRNEQHNRTKMVLFLGRVTFQKGPEYFIEAAAKVIPVIPDVVFVIAGTGDMLPALKQQVQEMGLEGHFMFPGFLKGPEIERMFSMADVYVMPSVSEPFGITPLEAMSHDVPVIISKQSGVSELLRNAFKVDFWDVEKTAHLIIGILKYPEIRDDIVDMAREEVRRIHWDAAASKTLNVYRNTIAGFKGRK